MRNRCRSCRIDRWYWQATGFNAWLEDCDFAFNAWAIEVECNQGKAIRVTWDQVQGHVLAKIGVSAAVVNHRLMTCHHVVDH